MPNSVLILTHLFNLVRKLPPRSSGVGATTEKQTLDLGSRRLLHRRQDVSVDVHGGRHLAVAEPLTDHSYWNPSRNERRRMRVTSLVRSNLRHARSLAERLEGPGDVAWGEG